MNCVLAIDINHLSLTLIGMSFDCPGLLVFLQETFYLPLIRLACSTGFSYYVRLSILTRHSSPMSFVARLCEGIYYFSGELIVMYEFSRGSSTGRRGGGRRKPQRTRTVARAGRADIPVYHSGDRSHAALSQRSVRSG